MSVYTEANATRNYVVYSHDLWKGFLVYVNYLAPQGKRATGLAYPNFLSIYLAFSYIAGLYVLRRVDLVLHKVLIRFILAFYMLGIFYPLSKGGIVSFVGAVTVYYLMEPTLRKKWLYHVIAFFLAFGLVFLVVSYVKLEGGVGRLSKGYTGSQAASSSGARKIVWAAGWKSFVDTYALGQGVGSTVSMTTLDLHSHNEFFGFLFELGVLGFLLFVWIHYVFIRQTFRYGMLSGPNEHSAVFAALAAMLVQWTLQSQIEFDYYLPRIPWFFLGLALAVIIMRKRSLQCEAKPS